MIGRFLAVSSPTQVPCALDLHLDEIAHQSGLSVTHRDERLVVYSDSGLEINHLTDGTGVVVGDVFCRHVPSRAFGKNIDDPRRTPFERKVRVQILHEPSLRWRVQISATRGISAGRRSGRDGKASTTPTGARMMHFFPKIFHPMNRHLGCRGLRQKTDRFPERLNMFMDYTTAAIT